MAESPSPVDAEEEAESLSTASADGIDSANPSTDGKASDMEVVQLLIAVSNITASASNAFERQNSQCSPAERLLRAIKTVMTEKQRQFVHYRLQWLIFEHNKPSPQEFTLPEGVSTPRGVHNVDKRLLWWRHARDHPDTQRKQRGCRARAAQANPCAGAAAAAATRPSSASSQGKRASFMGRDGKRLGPPPIDTGEAEEDCMPPLGRKPLSMSCGKARSHRDSVMRHASSERSALTGAGFSAAVRQAAHAASHAHQAATRMPPDEPVEKSRCGALDKSPTGSHRRFSLQSQCALERSETSTPTRQNIGLTTQELLAKARAAREATQGQKQSKDRHRHQGQPARQGSKCAKLTGNATATHSAPTVFLTSQPLEEDTETAVPGRPGPAPPGAARAAQPLEAALPAAEPPEAARSPAESDEEAGGQVQRTESSTRRRSVLADSVIDASGGMEASRLQLEEPIAAGNGTTGARPHSAQRPPSAQQPPAPAAAAPPAQRTPGAAACRPTSSSTASTRAPSATQAHSTSSTAAPAPNARGPPGDPAPAAHGSASGPPPFSRLGRRALGRSSRSDQLYVQQAQTMQVFETLRNSQLRYETTRTMTGIYQEDPLPMAPAAMTAAAMAEWSWRPGMSLGSSRSLASRPSSAPNLGQLQRLPPEQRGDSAVAANIGDTVIRGLWGPNFAKDSLPVPQATRKTAAVASRQASIDGLINSRLDSRLQLFRAGTKLREKGRASAAAASTRPCSASSVPSAAAGDAVGRVARPLRCPSAPSRPRPAAPAKPPKPACAQTCTPPHCVPGPLSGELQAHAYLEKVDAVHGVPAVFKVLQDAVQEDYEEGDHCSPRPLDLRFLNLSDKEAGPILTGLEVSRAPFNAVLSNGNPRLTDTSYVRLLRLVSKHAQLRGGRLQRLDLSGARGMHEVGIRLLAKELRGVLKGLHAMSLEGIAIPERVWPELEAGIQPLLQLEDLCLANTQIGRESQRSAVSVAEMLLGLPVLKDLDISGNFFNFEGCKALASCLGQHRNLTKLDLSHNAGGFVQISLGATRQIAQSQHPASASFPRFNPISLVCESIANARALKVLHLANCQLNYDEDFVIEVALAEKLVKSGCGMEELDLSGNPCQGAMGARCLLRMVVLSPSLRRLDVGEFREALPPSASIPYEFCDPSCHYEADLSHPQHRAVLRMVLRRCTASGESLAKVLEFQQKPLGEELVKLWRAGEFWPETGQVGFSCNMGDVEVNTANDIVKLIDSISLKRKLKVSLWAFVRVAELFRNMKDDEARRVLIAAMASDLLLKLSHVRCLSEMSVGMRIEIIERLLPAVHPLDRMGGFDTFMAARGENALPMHIHYKPTLELLVFNAYCPNGRYDLQLNYPAHRRIMEELLVVNEWDRARCKADDYCDLSQHGDHEAFRNVLLNSVSIIWRSDEAAIPSRGELMFDYCSPFHPASDSMPVQDAVLDLVISSVEEATVDPWPKLATLRTVLHRLVLLPEQCGRLIEVMPSAETSFQNAGSDVISLRVDAFVALYPRCNNIGGLLSSERHGLYGLQLLARQEVLNVRSRLGRLRTWDITRCDQEQLVPGAQTGANVNVRKMAAEADKQQMQRVLAELRLRDDFTSRGLANRYTLDLEAVFEDWKFATVLMELAKKEDGEHFDNPTWSEKAQLEEKGSRWLVPQEWFSDVPKQGVVSLTYFSERASCKDEEVRRSLAAKHLGW